MPETTNIYPGQVSSALKRVRKILRDAGYSLGKVTGPYSPFGNTQTSHEGPNASRVGCSRWISLHWTHSSPYCRKKRSQWMPEILALLREAGLPFDDKGWLECKYY